MFSYNDLYIVSDKENFKFFLNNLEGRFNIESESLRKNDITFFDTFDWRLFSGDKFLISTSKGFFYGDSASNSHFIRTKKKIQFAKDFPPSDVRESLVKISGLRKYVRNYKFNEKKSTFKVLNADRKIVCRFSLYEYTRKDKSGIAQKTMSLKIDSLRGYKRYSNEISNSAGEILKPSESRTQMEMILALTGEIPGGYSSKPKFTLDHNMPSWLALKNIYSELFSIMEQNEEGIIKNTDNEFLHDYRVAVRRTRSALSQLTRILPKEKSVHFRQGFKFIQNATNSARDFDVDIENKEDYKAILPVTLHAGVDSLTKYLKKERTKVQQSLVQFLNSERYLKLKKEWSVFISELGENITDSGNTFLPADKLAAQNINSLLKKTILAGEKITEDSPDEEYHEFRIRLKKLRYLLEFFTGLFPQKQMEFILRQLKLLQDNLGEFNDICIQQVKLSHYLTSIKLKPAQEKLILPAIGGLIAVKEQRKKQIRNDFFLLYAEFSKKKNMRKFFEIFTI